MEYGSRDGSVREPGKRWSFGTHDPYATWDDRQVIQDHRIFRYGGPVGVMLVGVACGATLSGVLGGTLATVLIAVGMLAFLVALFRDLGLSDGHERRPRRVDAAPSPRGEGPHAEDACGEDPRSRAGDPHAEDPHAEEEGRHGHRPAPRRRELPRRPERLRGQRRRLR